MNFWMRSFRRPVRPEHLAILTVAVTSALMMAPAYAQKRDYFTELEVADIREAQEIGHRTEVLLEIAGRRLAGLDPEETDTDDSSGGPGFGSKLGRVFITIFSPQAAAEIAAVEEERARLEDDLAGHTRADLLRGYYQALEETMDNIDDAHERGRGDVRDSLRTLKDFSEAALDLLRDVEPESEDEEDALEEALEQTEIAFKGAEKALETL